MTCNYLSTCVPLLEKNVSVKKRKPRRTKGSHWVPAQRPDSNVGRLRHGVPSLHRQRPCAGCLEADILETGFCVCALETLPGNLASQAVVPTVLKVPTGSHSAQAQSHTQNA